MKGFFRTKWKERGPVNLFRSIWITLFGIGGAVACGSFAVPFINSLSEWLTVHLVMRGATAPVASYPNPLKVAPFVLLGGIIGGFAGSLLLRLGERIAAWWARMELGDKVNLFGGSFVGLFVAIQFVNILFQNVEVAPAARVLIFIVLIVGFSSLIIYSLHSLAEILPWSKTKVKTRRSGIKVMDTNIIIDGRIYDIAKTGFLDGQLYVPGFVLDELQYIADSHDQLRRQRGRRGLEVLRHMQNDFQLDVRIHDKLAPDNGDEVDARLVRLAKALGGDILTNDYNLKRVAELQDVRVLSLNELSLALRPNVLPQESLHGLKIIREGNQYGQGIGYLEDGTMVVVENGLPHVGETRDVVVTQVIQTERGKMIFAEISGESAGEMRSSRRRRLS
ncbi:MAG TPA: PIN domain-containing protein [Fimbriimonas sp.]|nr:PIN domain-containing protein [Fimbriimonas sp.]